MKIKILFSTLLVGVVALALTDQQAMTRTNGAPGGNTGSPQDGSTCGTSQCHNTTATFTAGMITTNIPAAGYAPGETYNVTASVTQTGRSKFGFELTEEDAAGNKKGTIVATTATQLKLGGRAITHRSTSTSATDSKAWTFTWIAPAAGAGEVNFWAAFNAANGNNNASGDFIFTSSLTVQEGPPVGIETLQTAPTVSVYPNPATSHIFLSGETESLQNARLYDLNGRLVSSLQVTSEQSIELPNVEAGTYFLQFELVTGPVVKKIVVQ